MLNSRKLRYTDKKMVRTTKLVAIKSTPKFVVEPTTICLGQQKIVVSMIANNRLVVLNKQFFQ